MASTCSDRLDVNLSALTFSSVVCTTSPNPVAMLSTQKKGLKLHSQLVDMEERHDMSNAAPCSKWQYSKAKITGITEKTFNLFSC
jgi:hypothetical protein